MQPYAATVAPPVKSPKPVVKPGEITPNKIVPGPRNPNRPKKPETPKPNPTPTPSPKPELPKPKSVPKPFVRPKPKTPTPSLPPSPKPLPPAIAPPRKPLPRVKPVAPSSPFFRPRPGYSPDRNNPIKTPEIDRIRRRREEERERNNPNREKKDWGDDRSPFYDPSRPLFHPLHPDTWDQPIQKPREYGPFDPAKDLPQQPKPTEFQPNRWKPFNPNDLTRNFPWPKPQPKPPYGPQPKPDLDPSGRPWSTPDDLDKIFRPWEHFPEPQPEENPYDGPIWSPTGDRSENPDECVTAIRFESKDDPNVWGWIGFQTGFSFLGQDEAAMVAITMNNGNASEQTIREYKNDPKAGYFTGVSISNSSYWNVLIPGIGGDLNVSSRDNASITYTRTSENVKYKWKDYSNFAVVGFDYTLITICPTPGNGPKLDDPLPENPYPDEDDDMPCRYLKDMQQTVTVRSFDEKKGTFYDVKIRCHEAETDVPVYISKELEKMHRKLDQMHKAMQAEKLQATQGLILKPKLEYAVAKAEINQTGAYRARTIQQAEMAMLTQVEHLDAVAAVPEWWQNRVGANRPQGIIQYAEKRPDGLLGAPMYAVTIPHYKLTAQETTQADFPAYKKGSFMAVATLPDNSKIIINAFKADDARYLVLNLVSKTKFKQTDAEVTISERKGQSLKEIMVYPKIVKFYSTGQKSLKPDWIKYVNVP